MAQRLTVWTGIILLGCATIAGAYLPPRGSVMERRARTDDDSPYLRAFRRYHAATEDLASAQRYLRRLELFEGLVSQYRASAEGTSASYALHVDPILPRRVEDVSRNLVGAMAARIEMRATPVFVVTHIDTTSQWWWSSLEYALPESPNDPCVSITELGRSTTERIARGRIPVDGVQPGPVQALLGPCAYYAVFGHPGPRILNWLTRTRFSTALLPNWAAEPRYTVPIRPRLVDVHGRIEFSELRSCVAGNRAVCRRALFHEESSTGGSRPRRELHPQFLVPFPRYFRYSTAFLGALEVRYLSDLVIEQGHDRFQRFWSSDLSVDSAFAQAFGIAIEEWTMEWAQRHIGNPRRGPHVRLTSSVLACVLAGAFVATAVALATKRQVA